MVPERVPVMEGESKGDSPELRVGDLVEVQWALGDHRTKDYHDIWMIIEEFSKETHRVIIGPEFLGPEERIYSHINVARLVYRADS